jgi:hypothetical protein
MLFLLTRFARPPIRRSAGERAETGCENTGSVFVRITC